MLSTFFHFVFPRDITFFHYLFEHAMFTLLDQAPLRIAEPAARDMVTLSSLADTRERVSYLLV